MLDARQRNKDLLQGHRVQVRLSVMKGIDILHELKDNVRPVDHVNVDAVEHAQPAKVGPS